MSWVRDIPKVPRSVTWLIIAVIRGVGSTIGPEETETIMV